MDEGIHNIELADSIDQDQHLTLCHCCQYGGAATESRWSVCLRNHLQAHFDPLLSHAKADAPPTGLVDRGFVTGGRFSSFSPDTVRLKEGAGAPVVASPSSFLFPSSKKRDCPVPAAVVEEENVREDDLEGLNTLISRRGWFEGDAVVLPTFAQSSEPPLAFSFVSRRQLLSMAGDGPEREVAVAGLASWVSLGSDRVKDVDRECDRWSRLLRPLEPPSSELAVVALS